MSSTNRLTSYYQIESIFRQAVIRKKSVSLIIHSHNTNSMLVLLLSRLIFTRISFPPTNPRHISRFSRIFLVSHIVVTHASIFDCVRSIVVYEHLTRTMDFRLSLRFAILIQFGNMATWDTETIDDVLKAKVYSVQPNFS